MAYEVQLVLRFEDFPPTTDDIEYLLECVVQEIDVEEV